MKSNRTLSAVNAGVMALSASATPGALPEPPQLQPQRVISASGTALNREAPQLTKFDLDFAGGAPQQFVAAIEKAMGRPINAIISEDQASVKIPPLKMMGVDLPQLFASLRAASVR